MIAIQSIILNSLFCQLLLKWLFLSRETWKMSVSPWPLFSNYLMSVGLAAGLLALFSTSNKWITAQIEQQQLACVGKREPPGQIDSHKSHQNTITYFYTKSLVSVVKSFCIFFMDFLKLYYKTFGIKPKRKKENFLLWN